MLVIFLACTALLTLVKDNQNHAGIHQTLQSLKAIEGAAQDAAPQGEHGSRTRGYRQNSFRHLLLVGDFNSTQSPSHPYSFHGWSDRDQGKLGNRPSRVSLIVNTQKYNDYFIKNTQKTLAFEILLNQLISVTEGIAKAIQCLEAQACNAADVYLLWLAVTAHVRAALHGSMIPEDVCNEIRGIINHRWNEFFVTNLGHEIYLAAFYLNPSKPPSA